MYLAVHTGAGEYNDASLSHCRASGQAACQTRCESAVDACVSALTELENCEFTNAGVGSNLTRLETVECDAGVVTASQQRGVEMGHVGCVELVKNPVKLAKQVLTASSPDLQKPLSLVGRAAYDFAGQTQCSAMAKNHRDMTTAYCRRQHRHALAKLSNPANGQSRGQEHCSPAADTVGCVALSLSGVATAGASSGGPLLRAPGRLGPAAVPGCASFAMTTASCMVAVCVSGNGELLLCTTAARSLCEAVLRDVEKGDFLLTDTLELFCTNAMSATPLVSTRIVAVEQRKFGFLVLLSQDTCVELAYAHNTPDFIFCYTSPVLDKPRSLLSRQRSAGSSVVVGSIRL